MKKQMIQNKIKEVRQQKGISLYQLSKETGLSYRGLWNVEKGGDVRLSTLYRIAEALCCNISDLV